MMLSGFGKLASWCCLATLLPLASCLSPYLSTTTYVKTFAGALEVSGSNDSNTSPTDARFIGPISLAFDSSGHMIVADYLDNKGWFH